MPTVTLNVNSDESYGAVLFPTLLNIIIKILIMSTLAIYIGYILLLLLILFLFLIITHNFINTVLRLGTINQVSIKLV